jgi:hypothetical protein
MNLTNLKEWAINHRAQYNAKRGGYFKEMGIKDDKHDTADVFLRSIVTNVEQITKNNELTARCMNAVETALTQLTKIGLNVPEEKKRVTKDEDFDTTTYQTNSLGL